MKRGTPEAEFLPAAMALEATPPSPLGRTLIWLIIVIFCVAAAGATWGRVDMVSVARARVIVVGHSKIVRPLERGTVAQIAVTEGQRVSAGELLLRLEDDVAAAELERVRAALAQAERRDAGLRWLIALHGSDTDTTDGAVVADPAADARWAAHRDRDSVLEQEIRREQSALAQAEAEVARIRDLLPFLRQEAVDRASLAEQDLLPTQHARDARKTLVDTRHELRIARLRVAELRERLAGLHARRRFADSQFRDELVRDREQATGDLRLLRRDLRKAEAALRATVIRSPVDGTVEQLGVHHVGAVVAAGQDLLVVVPRGQGIAVEATLQNSDVGFVRTGQQVEAKFDAFPFTRYGTVTGRVTAISADAINDEHAGLTYRMRVDLDADTIDVDGENRPLTPGMTLTVEAKTGTRRLISFFLSPLMRYADEGLRER